MAFSYFLSLFLAPPLLLLASADAKFHGNKDKKKLWVPGFVSFSLPPPQETEEGMGEQPTGPSFSRKTKLCEFFFKKNVNHSHTEREKDKQSVYPDHHKYAVRVFLLFPLNSLIAFSPCSKQG